MDTTSLKMRQRRMLLSSKEKGDIRTFAAKYTDLTQQAIANHFTRIWNKPVKRRTVADIITNKHQGSSKDTTVLENADSTVGKLESIDFEFEDLVSDDEGSCSLVEIETDVAEDTIIFASQPNIARSGRRVYNCLTTEQKREICLFSAEQPSASQQAIADHFTKIWKNPVRRRTVGDILLAKEKYLAENMSPYTLQKKRNKSPKHIQMEMALFDWLKNAYVNSYPVRQERLLAKAKELGSEMNIDCQFSNGWFARFKQRHNISIERVQMNGRLALIVDMDPTSKTDFETVLENQQLDRRPHETKVPNPEPDTNMDNSCQQNQADSPKSFSSNVQLRWNVPVSNYQPNTKYSSDCMARPIGSKKNISDNFSTASDDVQSKANNKVISTTVVEYDFSPSSHDAKLAVKTLLRYFENHEHATEHDVMSLVQLQSRVADLAELEKQTVITDYFKKL